MNKYKQTPEYILDLHGKTCAETKAELLRLLREEKYRHVRIITGKGTFREKGGVLRDFVKTFLCQNAVRFLPSKIEDGGDGALEVFF